MDWIRLIKAIGITVLIAIQLVIFVYAIKNAEDYSDFGAVCEKIFAVEMGILFFGTIAYVAYICL